MKIKKNKHEERILNCLEQNGEMSKSKIAILCGINQYTIDILLNNLEKKGIVKQVISKTNYKLTNKNEKNG